MVPSHCGGGEKGKKAIDAYEALGHMLEDQGVDFDIIDEKLVESATVENGVLKTEHVAYESVFVPEAAWEKKEILDKLAMVGNDILPVIRRKNSELISKKLCWEDDSELYFICNFNNKTVAETIGVFSDKNVYKLNLETGEFEEIEAIFDGEACNVPICLHRGEGILLWFSEKKIPAKKMLKTNEEFVLSTFESYPSRQFSLDIEKGISYDDCEKPQTLKQGLYEWDNDFSGEVTYFATIPKIPDGEYILELGEVRDTAQVYVNDRMVGAVIMPPYQLSIGQIKTGDVLKIKVANTAANVCDNSKDYFAAQHPGEVSMYHKFMKPFETLVEPGGLFGPVVVKKIAK